ncbi:MAG TPA: DUF1460 domain-containing protein [Candidatus Dadabacteria bacterium]|jgi:hypothetical protein|nr:DUF1460 domain-containing protein [Candidatus Dadabacteria bacterium]
MKLKKERLFNFYLLIGIFLIFLPFQYVHSHEHIEYEARYADKINYILKTFTYDDLKSEVFLGVPYKSNTLIGDKNTKEKLVVNLEAMDCFTYLDYVHALRVENPRDYYDFIDNLKHTRYKKGVVSFETRNHFFYDWSLNVQDIKDITKEIRHDKVTTVTKRLNKKSDGSLFVDGIPIREVEISYLNPRFLTKNNLNLLNNLDYIGIYSEKEGLDVSHVGILIIKGGKWYFRHASNKPEIDSVVDVDFLEYIKSMPGIIVYRYTK